MSLRWLFIVAALVTSGYETSVADGFSVLPMPIRSSLCQKEIPSQHPSPPAPTYSRSKSQLRDLVDVPDGFFTFTFPVLGIILSISKSFGRLRMEERAWEQRLEEAREKRLREDPTLTEIDLRRKEAALEWSAYGKPTGSSPAMEPDMKNGSRRVRVMERTDEEQNSSDTRRSAEDFRMSDQEIALFEAEYGISYDPYYDDPYSEEELPDDIPFNVDRRYGDRIYENGEIFYKDKESGLFYRQGAKPRSLTFWK